MACLQDFPSVENELKRSRKNVIEAMHKFIFEQIGDRRNRQRLRNFRGFTFDATDERYHNKCRYISENLGNGDLTMICVLLGLDCNVEDVKLHIFNNLISGQLLKDANEVNDDDDEDIDENEEEDHNEIEVENRSVVGESAQSDDYFSVTKNSTEPVKTVNQNQLAKRNCTFAFNFKDVEDSMHTFDGSDKIAVETWIQEFEEMAVIMDWDQLHMLVFAKKSLRGLARSFVMGERDLTTWSKLRNALLNEFTHKINSAQIHKRLSERKMKKEENVQEYFYKMKEIANQGNVEEAALIQHVIDGIKDLHINKTLLYGANTIQEFKEKLRTYETFTMQQKYFNEPKNYEKKPMTKSPKVYNKVQNKCFNCGDNGHLASDCKHKEKGVKCFKCNSFGHYAKDCIKTVNRLSHDTNIHRINVHNNRMMIKAVIKEV